MNIGVLALQGDFYLHQKRLTEVGVTAVAVRKPEQLEGLAGLVIPGGESTTLVKLMRHIGLDEAIPRFAERAPVFGTCAGAILVSRTVTNHPVPPFNLIDMTIHRNAYGTQVDSFSDDVTVDLGEGMPDRVEGVFIRAPRIVAVGDGVRVIGTHGDDVVMVENDRILAATFHPELARTTAIHAYFVRKCRLAG